MDPIVHEIAENVQRLTTVQAKKWQIQLLCQALLTALKEPKQ